MSSWRWPARSQENSTPQLPTAFRTFCSSASSRAWDCSSLVCHIATSYMGRATALTFESIGGVFGPPGMRDKLRESIAADFQKIAEDPIIAKRLGDTGQIMSVLGPAQFGARVQEQRDKLATLAKTLGVKAAQ